MRWSPNWQQDHAGTIDLGQEPGKLNCICSSLEFIWGRHVDTDALTGRDNEDTWDRHPSGQLQQASLEGRGLQELASLGHRNPRIFWPKIQLDSHLDPVPRWEASVVQAEGSWRNHLGCFCLGQQGLERKMWCGSMERLARLVGLFSSSLVQMA